MLLQHLPQAETHDFAVLMYSKQSLSFGVASERDEVSFFLGSCVESCGSLDFAVVVINPVVRRVIEIILFILFR